MNYNYRQFILAVHIFILLLLCGCAVGTDYKKPDTIMPERWTVLENNSGINTDPASCSTSGTANWWKSFSDPVLTSLIEKGLNANHDVRMASARARQSRASKAASSSALWPQIDSSASYKRNGAENSGKSNFTESDSSLSSTNSSEYNNFKAGFDASWELDFFGGNSRGLEAAQADVKASEEDERGVALTVSAEIATNYLNLRAVQDQLETAKKNLDAQKQIFEITEKKYRAGLSGRLDYTSSKAQIFSSEAKIPELEAAERSLIYSIGVLTGEGTQVLLTLAKKTSLPPSPPSIPAGLPSDLLKRRPDIARAEAQLHAATARTGSAKADYFPKISLTGNWGYSGTDADSFLNWSSRSWSFGPSVSIPIFNAGKIAANVESKSALEEQALANYEKTILAALKDVETALYNYSSDIKKHAHLASSAKENSDAAEMAMSLYSTGKINYSRVLEARRSQYTSEEALAISNGILSTDIVSVYKSLGGGWKADPDQKN